MLKRGHEEKKDAQGDTVEARWVHVACETTKSRSGNPLKRRAVQRSTVLGT